jgi:hypothetical protein
LSENIKFRVYKTIILPAVLNQAGGETLLYEIQKLINGSTIVPIYKKGDETDCHNYRGISITAINFIQHFIEYPSLKVKYIRAYIDEIIGDNQYGF